MKKCKLNIYLVKAITLFLFLVKLACSNLCAQRPELIIPATQIANSIVISPDDKWMASAGKDGLKIWDTKT